MQFCWHVRVKFWPFFILLFALEGNLLHNLAIMSLFSHTDFVATCKYYAFCPWRVETEKFCVFMFWWIVFLIGCPNYWETWLGSSSLGEKASYTVWSSPFYALQCDQGWAGEGAWSKCWWFVWNIWCYSSWFSFNCPGLYLYLPCVATRESVRSIQLKFRICSNLEFGWFLICFLVLYEY